ncbi:hypothetical protein Scep_006470 [Stephania cephalantha]|uniref:Uncharacterized protein n=1 Tax=Stephania cephalantha TaxID=152367 RepID=A0AAP0PK40_9MAGN
MAYASRLLREQPVASSSFVEVNTPCHLLLSRRGSICAAMRHRRRRDHAAAALLCCDPPGLRLRAPRRRLIHWNHDLVSLPPASAGRPAADPTIAGWRFVVSHLPAPPRATSLASPVAVSARPRLLLAPSTLVDEYS